jgi:hypothetical protein
MYLITHHNKIILGPIEWNASFIASVLQNDLDLDERPVVLPSDVFKVPFYILPEIYVRNAVIEKPSYNSKIQKFGGVEWTFDENNGYANYSIINKDIEEVKGELKNAAASKRWVRENTVINLTINDVDVSISTARENRRVFFDKLLVMGANDVCSWKFDGCWIDLSKEDIYNIVKSIDNTVQDAFNWEVNKIDEIYACNTLSELDQINLDV